MSFFKILFKTTLIHSVCCFAGRPEPQKHKKQSCNDLTCVPGSLQKLEVSLVSRSSRTMRHTTSTCGLWQNSLPCRGHARDLLQHRSPRHSQDWRYHVQRWYHPVEQNETKMLNLEMLHCSHDLRPQITNPLISDPILWFSNFFSVATKADVFQRKNTLEPK